LEQCESKERAETHELQRRDVRAALLQHSEGLTFSLRASEAGLEQCEQDVAFVLILGGRGRCGHGA
jgi:hypothetical protein